MMKYESVENTETVQGREKHAPFPLNISPIVIIHTVLPRVLLATKHSRSVTIEEGLQYQRNRTGRVAGSVVCRCYTVT